MDATTPRGSARNEAGGLLTDLMNRVPGTQRVLLATGDGLKIGWTDQDASEADRLAALMTGLHSLARGAFVAAAGGVRQVAVEHDAGALFVMSAEGDAANPRLVGTLLGVVTTREASPGQVGFEMARVIKGLGAQLAVRARDSQPAGRGQ